MGVKQNRNPYVGVEEAITETNRTIRGNKEEIHSTGIVVAKIVKQIMAAMKEQSPKVFAKLFDKTFLGGSSYAGLKIGPQGDFDVAILLKIPQVTHPILHTDTIPGYAQLQLQAFENLQKKEPELFKAMQDFVDDQNFLHNGKLKSKLMQSVFDKACTNYFPKGEITIETENYKITRVEKPGAGPGPAFTLTIERANFFVQIDLVLGIVLPSNLWPKDGSRANPYRRPSEFYIVPKKPKQERPHIDRYFRMSFEKQERKLIVNKFWMKPTIRIMKGIRDKLDHDVSSYAIKTLFLWEQEDVDVGFWKRSPRRCLLDMLKKYSECLEKGAIWYFWSITPKLNLLDLSKEQIAGYKKDVDQVIKALEGPYASKEDILPYLR